MSVVLDLLPLDGRIILLEPNEDDDRRILAEAKRFQSAAKPAKRDGA